MSLPSRHPDRQARIVRAAVQLFARQGYHATSTREIARLADISENTLFRYFEHKESLFWEALRSCLADLRLRRHLQDCMDGGEPPETVLPEILHQLLGTTILQPELLRLIVVAFLELREKAGVICHEHLSPIFTAVNRYLATNVESGKIRKLDPAMVTTALAMTAMVHPEFSALIQGRAVSSLNIQHATQAYAKFWLDILLPSAGDAIHPTERYASFAAAHGGRGN